MTIDGMRRWRWLPLTAALCCALSASAQLVDGIASSSGAVPGQESGLSGDQPHTISGTVINSITGEPIYRALVQWANGRAVLTDHEGRFEFTGATAEEFRPWATKPGYFNEGTRFFRPSLRNSQAANGPVTIALVPEAILSGTVTDENGQPLQGIQVELKQYQVMNGFGRWQTNRQTNTNSEGEFRFADLQAGKYSLSTGFHMEGLPDSRSSVAYVPTQYPPASAAQPSSAVTLTPGQHLEANFSPPVERLYPVTGTVSGTDITSGISFEVETESGQPLNPFTRIDPETGEFRLLLPGGSYQLTVNSYGQPVALRGQQVVTVPQAPVRGVSIALESFATIPVEIETQSVQARKRLIGAVPVSPVCQSFPGKYRPRTGRILQRRAAAPPQR